MLLMKTTLPLQEWGRGRAPSVRGMLSQYDALGGVHTSLLSARRLNSIPLATALLTAPP